MINLGSTNDEYCAILVQTGVISALYYKWQVEPQQFTFISFLY